MTISVDFLQYLKERKSNKPQQHVYLDIDQVQIKSPKENTKEDKGIIIIDLFSNEE